MPYLALLFVAPLAFYSYIIVFRLNYLQIDHAGHMSSMVAFSRGWFHQFNDQSFLGNIQNLFYPPFEDFVGSLFLWIGVSPVATYKILLLVGVMLFHWALWKVSKNFSKHAQLWALFLCFAFYNIEKPMLTHYQGLSFVDVWITGLSSQIWGGVFFLLFISELLKKSLSTKKLILFLSLSILSHIVMTAVCVLLLVIFAILHKSIRKQLLYVVLWSLGLTAFWLGPFLLNRGELVPSNIVGHGWNAWELSFAILGAFVFRKNPKALMCFAAAILLVAPPHIEWLLQKFNLALPKFHYYRFLAPAYYLLIFGLAEVLSPWKKKSDKIFSWKLLVPMAFLIFFLVQHNWQKYEFKHDTLTPTEFIGLNAKDFQGPGFERTWTLSPYRNIDFGLDAYLGAQDSSTLFSKGLFWESARSNSIIASYLATLLGPPSMLDYFHFWGYPCEIQKCIMDRYMGDFAISKIVIPKELLGLPAAQDRKACWQEIFQKLETPLNRFVWQSEFSVSGIPFSIFQVVSKSASPKNVAINFINTSHLKVWNPIKDLVQKPVLEDAESSCRLNEKTSMVPFVSEEVFKKIKLEAAAPFEERLFGNDKLQRISSGQYVFELPENPQWIWIKLSYFKGWKLVNEHGKTFELYPASPGMIANAGGVMKLTYKRPWEFFLFYLMSFLTLVALLYFFKFHKLKL